VRLAAPLSPALRLGADKILTISNRYNRTQLEGDTPDIRGYPPAAQIMGVLMSSIFLDMLERDATTVRKINKMVDSIPASANSNYRHVDMCIIRPSQDLSAFCANCQPNISGSFGSLVKRLGTGKTKTPEWLSMVMFEPEYVEQLIEIGEKDAAAHADELLEFLDTQTASNTGQLKKVGSEKV